MTTEFNDRLVDALHGLLKDDLAPALALASGSEAESLVARLAKKIAQLEVRHKLLDEITLEAVSGRSIDDVLSHIFKAFRQHIPFDRIGVAVLVPDADSTALSVWVSSTREPLKIDRGYKAPLKGSSLAKVLETGEPRIINDLEQYLVENPQSEATRLILEEGIRSNLTCPLIAKGKPIGFLFFSSCQKNTYRDIHISVFTEIAHHVSVIVEQARAYDDLSRLNALKDKFLGIAAHDLRHPISVIKKYIELLMDGFIGGQLESSQKEVLGRMASVVENMLRLISDLLDVSAIEAGQLRLKLEQVPLEPFLKELFSVNNTLAASAGMILQLNLVPGLPETLYIDRERISQVFSNLLTNAVKFSRSGSNITIEAEANGMTVGFRVRDQGQGIPEEDQKKLFEDFARLSISPLHGEKSHGLGLAICRRIIEAHQGKMKVESKPGQGSTFSFVIPIRAGSQAPLSPAA